MLRASLCDYSDTYIVVKGTITTSNKRRATSPNNRKKKVKYLKIALFLLIA